MFGLATTALLVTTWGSAVTSNRATVESAVSEAVQADVVAGRLIEWAGVGLAEVADLPVADVADVADHLRDDPHVGSALTEVARELAGALFAEPGETVSIELTDELVPLAPVVAAEARRQGLDLEEEAVREALASMGQVRLNADETAAGTASRTSTALTVAAAVAAVLLLVFGTIAVMTASDRRAELRTLASRVTISAVSFAAMLRISAWILDPGGGGSPLRRSGAILLADGLRVPLILAAVGCAAWLVGRRTRPPSLPSEDVVRSDGGEPRPQPPRRTGRPSTRGDGDPVGERRREGDQTQSPASASDLR
jgi:hypothetical protein